MLLVETGSEANTLQHFISGFDDALVSTASATDPSSPPASPKSLIDVRLFIDGMYEYICDNHLVALAGLWTASNKSPLPKEVSDIEPQNLAVMCFVVFCVVEETVFVSLKRNIVSMLSSTEVRRTEQLLLAKMRALSQRSQSDWDLSPDLVSPHGFQSAGASTHSLSVTTHSLSITTDTVTHH